jgi:hypothetical protein
MLPSKLRNHDGPEYYLRPVDGNDAPRPQGSQYDARELETSLSVGHIYFHPGTRQPPIPPFADLQAFMVERPKLPIVVDRSNPQSPCEAPHIVLAQLHRAIRSSTCTPSLPTTTRVLSTRPPMSREESRRPAWIYLTGQPSTLTRSTAARRSERRSASSTAIFSSRRRCEAQVVGGVHRVG